MIRHVVLFSAQPGHLDDIEQGLRALERIPSAQVCQVRRNLRLDGQSQEIDVIVYAEFANEDDLSAFKNHPVYLDAVKKVRPLRQLRFVADCEV